MDHLTVYEMIYYFLKSYPYIALVAVLMVGWAFYMLWTFLDNVHLRRHQRLLADQETRRIEAIAKLSRDAQMKLLDTFPSMDPDDPGDVAAAKSAKRELLRLEIADTEGE